MAAGLPVVLTALPVFAEYVRFGEDALAVAPGDDQGLADALATVAHDDRVRATLVSRGRQLVAQYGWDKTARQHIALYDDLQTS
jgi:glycosyltransferase involved in cell wall biosynthesis